MPPLLNESRRRGLALIAALALTQAAAAGAAAIATRVLFEGLHGGLPVPPAALVTIALAGCVIAAARVGFAMIGERLGQAYALEIREALFRHATGLTATDIAARRVGYISLRFVGDMTAFKSWLAKGLPHLIAGLVQIPIMVFVMFLLAPVFGLIGLCLFTLALCIILLLSRGMGAAHKNLRKRRASIAADMSDVMPVAHDLGQLGRTKTEITRLRKSTGKMVEAALGRARRAELMVAVSDIAATCMAALFLWRAYVDGMDTGVVAGALAALGLGAAALRFIATALDRRGAFLAAEEKCTAALARPRKRPRSGRTSLGRKPLSLSVENIALLGTPAISFSVAAGRRLTLSGPAAEVSESLFSLIQGRDKCDGGRITLDGVDLEEIAPLSLRRRIGRVTASPLILRGSLRRTVTLGLRRRSSDQALLKLLKMLGFDAVRGDPNRALLDGGRDLTPSEKVRISLLNACLSQPGLLLIEAEASVHLGDLTEIFAATGIEDVTIIHVGHSG